MACPSIKNTTDKIVFFTGLLVIIISSCMCSSCNDTDDKEVPVYTEITTINEKDKTTIINAYTLGLNDIAFADSAKLYATNIATKKIAFNLSDFLSDLNGHLKSLAAEKAIILTQTKSIVAAGGADTLKTGKKSDFDKFFTESAVALLKNKLALFTKYSGETLDGDTKKYFESALPLLQKELDVFKVSSKNK